MIPTTDLWTIENYCKEKYGTQEKVIGIMIARYSLEEVKHIVEENYNYWNHLSGKEFDVFWIGYESIDFPAYSDWKKVRGINSLFYSDKILSFEVKKLRKEKFIDYRDGGCTLILVKYNGNELDFSDYLIKDLLEIRTRANLRKYMDSVIDFASCNLPISQIRKNLPKNLFANVGGVISLVTPLVGPLLEWIAKAINS